MGWNYLKAYLRGWWHRVIPADHAYTYYCCEEVRHDLPLLGWEPWYFRPGLYVWRIRKAGNNSWYGNP